MRHRPTRPQLHRLLPLLLTLLRARHTGQRRNALWWLRHHRIQWFWLMAMTSFAITAAVTWSIGSGSRELLPCRVSRVVDGDTVQLSCGPERHSVRVRLACIDAPETSQSPWGGRSTAHLTRLAGDRVELVTLGTDRWNRTIGRLIDQAGQDINLRMVADGWAAVYPRYCNDRAYYRAEAAARAQSLGIWMSNGPHQRPWEAR